MERGSSHKSILVTGGAGFIGSNFIPYFMERYPDYLIVNLDCLTYAGNLDNLKEVANNPNYHFVKGDICDPDLVERILQEFAINGIIHFAAESHVDKSITGPEVFIHTNIEGTFVLLEAARKYWMQQPGIFRSGYEQSRFHHISTDEVYGTLGETGYFTESNPYAPNSPYSASKASSDLIVRSYYHTYNMNTVISNCSNNYGPKQYVEKLIPTIINKALAGEKIPIYGDGKNVRDWLFVLDHCRGIDMIYHFGETGESYNIGGGNEFQNIVIAHLIAEILDEKADRKRRSLGIQSYKDMIQLVPDRPGHDRRYALDTSKVKEHLSWSPQEDFISGLHKTVDWYLSIWQTDDSEVENK